MQQIVKKLVGDGVITAPGSAKGKLLQAAARLFREKGYEKTTTRDLAEAIGILSGSLFHHFKSKQDILYAVMEETILFNTERLRAALDGLDAPLERLHALIRQELQFINGETGEAMAVLVFEWRALTPEKQTALLRLRDIYENIWLEVIEQNRKAGYIVTQPTIFRKLLTGTLSWSVNWFHPSQTLDLDGLAKEVMQFVGIRE